MLCVDLVDMSRICHTLCVDVTFLVNTFSRFNYSFTNLHLSRDQLDQCTYSIDASRLWFITCLMYKIVSWRYIAYICHVLIFDTFCVYDKSGTHGPVLLTGHISNLRVS